MEDWILLLALMINAFLWLYTMFKISWFRLVFLCFFEKSHDTYFQNHTIMRSLECSGVSLSFLLCWGFGSSLEMYTPLLGAASFYWFLYYHYKNFEIVKVCDYTLKEYQKIEALLGDTPSRSKSMVPALHLTAEEETALEIAPAAK